MAKVRPSNLFLRPLDLFCYLEKQTIKLNWDKFEQNCSYFFSIRIKKTKNLFCLAEIWIHFEIAALDDKSVVPKLFWFADHL